MHWTYDQALCGDTDSTYTVTGTSDTDYISYTEDTNAPYGVISFDLSVLGNRDVLMAVYVLDVSITVEIWLLIEPSFTKPYTFDVREYDCRP